MAGEFKSSNLNSYFKNVRLGGENQSVRANINLIDQSSAEDTLKDDDSVEKIFELHRLRINNAIPSLEETNSPRSSLHDSTDKKKMRNYLNNSLESSIISDVPEDFGMNQSRLDDEEELEVVHLPKKPNKMLSLSKEQLDLHLIQTQSAVETLKIVNRHNKRVTLQATLTDQMGGIHLVCPPALEPLSTCDLTIQIDEVEEIGDVYTSIAIAAGSKDTTERLEVPMIIHYTIPKLTVEYEGASQVIALSQGKFMDIKLPQNNFREHSLYLSSEARLQVQLSTPRVEATVFPDDLILMDSSKRKIGIRCRETRFCLVAKIKNTQLAFVFRVTIY